MGISPAEEKRQEEKRIKELRDFQRSNPANRRCFDCNEMMPQYVCLDFNTFVCTSCSGIHREFAHRVKSISMSKFTESEVKTLVKLGGNEAAQKYWRAKHDPSFRPTGGNEGDRTRNFIRLTYIDRKWLYESPRESKKDDPQKRTKSSDGDDFFASTGTKKAAAAPAFDAFGSSNGAPAAGGFAQFGDFSNFSNESAAPVASPSGFADFGSFGSASSSAASTSGNGFGDFGDFGGSSKGSPAPAPAPAAVRSDFGSFKLAPPPGSSFSSSASSSVSAAPTAVSTPPAKQASNDFMAFSPERVAKDPFGFDEPPAAKTASQSHATPFDAFGAPAPVSTGSRASSSSFDAFGSAPAPVTSATPPSFDAFGSPVKSTPAASAFDAFGASSSFEAFGGSSASASAGGFGDFASATPARSSSGTLPVADPFSAFSPRVSSGTNKAPEPAAAADPFAAFDAMDAGAPSVGVPAGRSTGSFGAGGLGANAGPGFPGSNAPSNDPFAFAGNSGSKSNSFSNPGAPGSHQPNGGASSFAQGFAGAGVNPYQQQQPQQFAQNANQMYNPMGTQQQHASHQQQGFPQQQQQQQQWYGQPQQQQQYPGQQPGQQQYPGQHPGPFPHHPSTGNGGMPAAIPVQAKPAAVETPAINDPFAALNIGLGSSSQAPSNSRGNSFEQKKPSSASGSFSNGQPVAPSPFQAHQGLPHGGNAFGGGFPVAAPAGGSRGNSFESHATPAAPFGAPVSNASFSYPQPQAAAFPGPSQSPMSSFSTPGSSSSQTSAFGDNAFGAFTSAPRAESFKGPSSSASPAANPFDMF
ncbi:hypothetical protein Gpo141_00005434 [Globisporangium polare]